MALPVNEYEELLVIEGIVKDKLDGVVGFESVQVFSDLDVEFDLMDSNQDSTPVVLLELDLTASTKAGSKGGMLAGSTRIDLSIIVAKGNREFAVYYKELVELVAKIRNIFLIYPDKRIEYVDTTFINRYVVGEYDAVGAGMTVAVPVGNFDYTI